MTAPRFRSLDPTYTGQWHCTPSFLSLKTHLKLGFTFQRHQPLEGYLGAWVVRFQASGIAVFPFCHSNASGWCCSVDYNDYWTIQIDNWFEIILNTKKSYLLACLCQPLYPIYST